MKARLIYILCAILLALNAQAQEYVDLGLSVNWATYNVGAKSIDEIGIAYIPGTLIPYSPTIDIASSMVNHKEDFSGNPEYDVAAATWERGWRTPTYQEWKELCSKCKIRRSIYKTQNGDKLCGCTVIGPNGNSIFIPVSYKVFKSWSCYQCSSAGAVIKGKTYPDYVFDVGFFVVGGKLITPTRIRLFKGFYVRPVIDKQQ